MEEAKDYKKYLKALKEATRKKGKSKKGTRDFVGLLGMRSVLKRNTGGAMLKNPKKADLNKDGKLSGYEKKRGMAIEASMKAARGKAVSRKEYLRKKQSPHSEYDKKGKLKYTAAKMGKSIRGYGAARTSGMGLQDEEMKPGKVMMANKGKQASIGYKAPPSPERMARLESKYKRNVNPMKAERIAEGDRGRRKEFFKRLRKLPKIAGSMVPGSISVAEAKKIKSFLPGKKKVSGRMGGGMMNKPMGYKKGSSIMARGCKLGRKKATKLS